MITHPIAHSYKTGFPSIDNNYNGINTKDLFVIGSRPAVGKTSLALSIAKGIIQNTDIRIAPKIWYFSLEHSKEEICKHLGDVSGKITVEDSVYSTEEIIDRITALSEDRMLKVFFIDCYSKLISLDSENNEQFISKLKTLAKTLNVAIVVLDQIYISKPTQWSLCYQIDEKLCDYADSVLIIERDENSKVQAHWAKDNWYREENGPFLLKRSDDIGLFEEITKSYFPMN